MAPVVAVLSTILRCRLLVVLSYLLAVACSRSAFADRSVSGVQSHSGGWIYSPTLSESGMQVETVLALRVDGNAFGDNIAAVWFRRSAGASRSEAWTNAENHAEIVKHVIDDLRIPAATHRLLPVLPAAPRNERPRAHTG